MVDDVSFTQTHVVSDDFRVYPKSSMSSVQALQQEQRKRIEQTYSARTPSPDFLGSQLHAQYRGELASLQLAKESGDPNFPTLISQMTSEQRKAFKRRMKRHIHDWVFAVCEATGQGDVLPHQKASLHAIYDLYRAVKFRILGIELWVAQPSSGTEPSVNQRDVSTSVANTQVSERRGDSTQSSTAPLQPRSSWRKGSPPSLASTATSNSVTAGGSGSAPLGTAATSTTTTANNSTASTAHAATGAGAAPADWQQRIQRVPIGTAEVAVMSDQSLQEEKRALKEVLHCFENEYERWNGARPSPFGRHGFTAEYYRYGMLKKELLRRSQKN